MSSGEESKQTMSDQSSAKHEFFRWAMKWNYGNLAQDNSSSPDLPSLINLMQIAGFKLRKFDKFDGFYNYEALDSRSVRITLECGNSHMIAVLEMDPVQCSCPETSSSDSDGSFWSVSTNGHWGSVDNVNAVCGFSSNLLPVVPKDTTFVLRDVVNQLFKMLNIKNSPKKPKTQPLLNRSSSELNLTYRRNDDEPIHSNLTKREFSSTQNLARLSLPVSMSLPGNRPIEARRSKLESSTESLTPLAKQKTRPRVIHQETYQVTGKSDDELPKNNSANSSQRELAEYIMQAHNILEEAMQLMNRKPTTETSKPTKSSTKDPNPTSPDLNGSFVISTPRRAPSSLSKRHSLSNNSLASSHDSRSTGSSRLPPRPSTKSSIHDRRSIATTRGLPAPKISSRFSSANTTFRKQNETSSASSLASTSQLRRQSLTGSETSRLPTISRNNSLKSDKQSPATSTSTRSKIPSPATEQSLIKAPGRISDSLISRFGYMGLSRKS